MLGGWSEANPRQRNRNPYLKIIKAKKKKKTSQAGVAQVMRACLARRRP
jgi:hypothetical protein